MKKIMHIIATPRGNESRTLKVSTAFIDSLKKNNPDVQIDELNLYQEQLPDLSVKQIDGKWLKNIVRKAKKYNILNCVFS